MLVARRQIVIEYLLCAISVHHSGGIQGNTELFLGNVPTCVVN